MIIVSLEHGHWLAVINMMAEQPYRISGPLILEINRQIGPQLAHRAREPVPQLQAALDSEAAAA